MLEVPSRRGATLLPAKKEALRTAPVRADWWSVPGTVVHVFTHFRLELVVYRALVPADASSPSGPSRSAAAGSPAATSTPALPSVMRKVIAHGLDDSR